MYGSNNYNQFESGEGDSSERANWEIDIYKDNNLSDEILEGQFAMEEGHVKSEQIKGRLSRKQGQESKRRILPYFLVALFSSLLGGIIVGASAYFILPHLEPFKDTALSKAILNSNETNTQTSQPSLISSGRSGLSVSEIAKIIGPAVVGVSNTSMVNDMFGWPFTQQEQESMGSGIIFDREGYIVTNFHVIDGAQQIKVILNNGKEVKAKVINYDVAADIAVIKMTEKVEIPGIAEFGDSDKLEIGELAVAVGNPLGKELLGSVTAGVISAVNREITLDGRKLKLVQTDAAINPGNSGGPLVNSQGQVIGINTVKMASSTIEGLGFAIPINEVKPKIQELIMPRLKVGIEGKEITEEKSKQYDLPVGVYILGVEEFSPAQRAGIMVGDVIVKFAGVKIKTVNDINKIKANYKAGNEVLVEVVRDGDTKVLKLKFIEEKL